VLFIQDAFRALFPKVLMPFSAKKKEEEEEEGKNRSLL
jgi:hypothetical protein